MKGRGVPHHHRRRLPGRHAGRRRQDPLRASSTPSASPSTTSSRPPLNRSQPSRPGQAAGEGRRSRSPRTRPPLALRLAAHATGQQSPPTRTEPRWTGSAGSAARHGPRPRRRGRPRPGAGRRTGRPRAGETASRPRRRSTPPATASSVKHSSHSCQPGPARQDGLVASMPRSRCSTTFRGRAAPRPGSRPMGPNGPGKPSPTSGVLARRAPGRADGHARRSTDGPGSSAGLASGRSRSSANALARPPHQWTPEVLWSAYETLDTSRVRRGGRAYRDRPGVPGPVWPSGRTTSSSHTPRPSSNASPVGSLQQTNSGRTFTPEQMQWLERIREVVAASLAVSVDDFDTSPLIEHGGLGGAAAVFGDQLGPLLDELNEVLVA